MMFDKISLKCKNTSFTFSDAEHLRRHASIERVHLHAISRKKVSCGDLFLSPRKKGELNTPPPPLTVTAVVTRA